MSMTWSSASTLRSRSGTELDTAIPFKPRHHPADHRPQKQKSRKDQHAARAFIVKRVEKAARPSGEKCCGSGSEPALP
jgi:hypothetical protein